MKTKPEPKKPFELCDDAVPIDRAARVEQWLASQNPDMAARRQACIDLVHGDKETFAKWFDLTDPYSGTRVDLDDHYEAVIAHRWAALSCPGGAKVSHHWERSEFSTPPRRGSSNDGSASVKTVKKKTEQTALRRTTDAILRAAP